MSYLRPLASVTLVNTKARRFSSGTPPTNCQRTSGCSSVSLLIGVSMRVTRPAASRSARWSWKSSRGPCRVVRARRASSAWSSIAMSLTLMPRPYHTHRAAAKAPNPLMNLEPGTTSSVGGRHVCSGTFQGRPRCRSARRHQDIWLRHLGDVERAGTGSKPSAALTRSGAGTAWHSARTPGAGQSAVDAREAGRPGAGDIFRTEHLHHAVVVSDQATDRQSRADVELSRHSRLRYAQLLRRCRGIARSRWQNDRHPRDA